MATANEQIINIKLNVYAEQSVKSIGDMRNEMKLLNAAMSEAAATGDKTKFDALGKRMGELRNDMVDLKAQMKAADPGELLAGFTKMASGAVGAFGAITGAMSVFGGESKAMQELQKKSASIIQLMMGLEQARMLLIDKGARAQNMATLQGIANQGKLLAITVATTLGLGAMATAEVAVAGSTEMATVATWQWNAALLANPVILIAAGIVALVAGIGLLVYAMSDSTDATELNTESTKNLNAAMKELGDLTKITATDLTALQNEYNILTGKMSEHELQIKNIQVARDAEITALVGQTAQKVAAFEQQQAAENETFMSSRGLLESSKDWLERMAKWEQDQAAEKLAFQKKSEANFLLVRQKADQAIANENEKAAQEAAKKAEDAQKKIDDIQKAAYDGRLNNQSDYNIKSYELQLAYNRDMIKATQAEAQQTEEILFKKRRSEEDYDDAVLESRANTLEELLILNENKYLKDKEDNDREYQKQTDLMAKSGAVEIKMANEIAKQRLENNKKIKNIENAETKAGRERGDGDAAIALAISNNKQIKELKKNNVEVEQIVKDKYDKAIKSTAEYFDNIRNEGREANETERQTAYENWLYLVDLAKKKNEKGEDLSKEAMDASMVAAKKLYTFEEFSYSNLDALQQAYNSKSVILDDQYYAAREQIAKNFLDFERMTNDNSVAELTGYYKDKIDALKANEAETLKNEKLTSEEIKAIKRRTYEKVQELEDEHIIKQVERVKKSQFSIVSLETRMDASRSVLKSSRQKSQNEELYRTGAIDKKRYEERITEIEEDAEERRKEVRKKRNQEIAEFSIGLAETTANAIMTILSDTQNAKFDMEKNASDTNFEREKSDLERSVKYNEMSESEKEAAISEINDRKVKKDLEMKQKAFEYNKKMSLIQLTIDTASAIGKTFAVMGWPAGIAGAIVAAATGLAQAAVIMNQKPPTYARGGLIGGKKHYNGGEIIEAESGEVILNANSMNNPTLRNMASAINVAGGGVPIPSSGGGSNDVSSIMSARINKDDLYEIVSQIQSIPVTVTETDITKAQRRVQTYETNSIIG